MFSRRVPVRACGLLLAAALMLAILPPAYAATIRVESGCTLEQAFSSALSNAAPSGSSCTAGDATGPNDEDVIVLTGDVTVTSIINIDVPGARQNRTREKLRLEGNGHTIAGMFTGESAVLGGGVDLRLTINNVRMTGGTRSFADFVFGSFLITNSIFEDNSVPANVGGAIAIGVAGQLTVEDSVFRNNSARSGGALYSSSAVSKYFRRVVFEGNSVTNDGGAVLNEGGTLLIEDSSFINNSAGVSGGAIFVVREVNVRNNTFVGNSAPQGAAIMGQTDSTFAEKISLEHITATGNTASASGAAVIQRHGTGTFAQTNPLTLVNSVVSGNSGDGLYCYPPTSDPIEIATGKFGIDLSGSYIDDGSCDHDINLANNGPAFLGPQQKTARGQVYFVPDKSGAIEEIDPVTGLPVTRTLPSPLIDAGDPAHCRARDQLGRSRSVGSSCDLGAIEVQLPRPEESRGTYKPTPARSTCLSLPASIRVSGLSESTECQRVSRAGIGVSSLRDRFIDAVDVWSWVLPDTEVCFGADNGRIVFIDTTAMPRTVAELSAYSSDGMTCATIDGAGQAVLMPESSAALPLASSRSLQNCMVRTNTIVMFRDGPRGALISFTDPRGDHIAGWLPADVTLTARERTNDWFMVDYHGERGWVSAAYVTPAAGCG